MAGLTHPWAGLTSQNSFGLGSTQWAWEPHPKFRVTTKINIFGYCSNSKILINLSLWGCLKKFGSKKFFERPTGGAPRQKNSFFSPDNSEIQNLPLIHLPIYKQIFFSGSSDQKNFFAPWAALRTKFFFGRMTPKKKFAYILVKGLMANFKFQNFWPKKMDFFCHGSLILPLTPLKFG